MRTIFFTGGGTLGPVTPLLAVYRELKRMTPPAVPPLRRGGEGGVRVVWVGTKAGPEREKLKLFPEIIFEHLPESKFDRFFSLRLFIAPLQFFAALLKSTILIIRYRPSLIVGSGGFMQVPLMWVGKQFGVSCVIHQLDVTPTLSNKLCAWVATKIMVNFEVTAKQFPAHKTIVVGNPVFVPPKPLRPDQGVGTPLLRKEGTKERLSPLYEGGDARGGFATDKPLLVVIGGGTGAEQLNRLTMLAADELTKMFNVVLISGGRPMGRDMRSHVSTGGLIVTSFVQDTYHLLEGADMVVTRAGMATLTEVACLGKPTVIVPIPHSHQEANARYYEEKEAAKVFWCGYDETEKRSGEFVKIIKEIWQDGKMKEVLVQNVRKLYNKEATKLIAEEIQKFLITNH